jgi:hypothetical protein
VSSGPSPGPGTKTSATATCDSGSLLGGGGTVVSGALVISSLFQSYPSASDTWTVGGIVANRLGVGLGMTVQAYVVCSGTAP